MGYNDMNLLPDADVPPRAVYVIDDDATIRRSTAFMLGSAGYAPRAFMSGIDFLDAADALAPGGILLDIRMPELDGLAFLERFDEALKARFPVVVVTGHGDLPTAIRAMKLGARDFVQKPFEEAVLLDILAGLSAELHQALVANAGRERAAALVARLSPRELEILKALMTGEPTKRAAHLLGISVRTAEMHRANMLERLGVRTLAEGMRIALAAGLAFE